MTVLFAVSGFWCSKSPAFAEDEKVDPEITYEIPEGLDLSWDGFYLNAKTINCDAVLTYEALVPDYLQVDQDGWVTIMIHDRQFSSPIAITVPETDTTKAKTFHVQIFVDWVQQTIECEDSYSTTMGKPVTIKATAVGPITFKSRDKDTATVSSKGKVKFKHPGTVTIRVRADVTGYYWYCEKDVQVTCKMTRPTLKVTTPKKGCAKLTWSKVRGAQHYMVYVKYPGKKKYRAVLSKPAKVKSVTHKGLKKGKRYSYKVRGYLVSSGGVYYGPFSKEKTVKIR